MNMESLPLVARAFWSVYSKKNANEYFKFNKQPEIRIMILGQVMHPAFGFWILHLDFILLNYILNGGINVIWYKKKHRTHFDFRFVVVIYIISISDVSLLRNGYLLSFVINTRFECDNVMNWHESCKTSPIWNWLFLKTHFIFSFFFRYRSFSVLQWRWFGRLPQRQGHS